MRHWPRHCAAISRSFALLEIWERPRASARHFIAFAPAEGSELPLFRAVGVPDACISFVGSAEDVLLAEEQFPNRRYIADDLMGALREHPRQFVTARIDANGPLSDAFLERFQKVLVHGVAEDGRISTVFRLGDEEGDIRVHLDECRARVFIPDGSPLMRERQKEVSYRIAVIQRLLSQRLGKASVFWEPLVVECYEDEYGRLEVAVTADVRRKRQYTHVLRDNSLITELAITYIPNDVTMLHAFIYEYVQNLLRAVKSESIPILAAMANLPLEQIIEWQTAPPSPSSTQSEQYSSPTFLSVTRGRRFSRS